MRQVDPRAGRGPPDAGGHHADRGHAEAGLCRNGLLQRLLLAAFAVALAAAPLLLIRVDLGGQGIVIVARGLRFAIVTALLWRFGEPIREFIERYLGILFTVFMVLLIGGFAAVKLVF